MSKLESIYKMIPAALHDVDFALTDDILAKMCGSGRDFVLAHDLQNYTLKQLEVCGDWRGYAQFVAFQFIDEANENWICETEKGEENEEFYTRWDDATMRLTLDGERVIEKLITYKSGNTQKTVYKTEGDDQLRTVTEVDVLTNKEKTIIYRNDKIAEVFTSAITGGTNTRHLEMHQKYTSVPSNFLDPKETREVPTTIYRDSKVTLCASYQVTVRKEDDNTVYDIVMYFIGIEKVESIEQVVIDKKGKMISKLVTYYNSTGEITTSKEYTFTHSKNTVSVECKVFEKGEELRVDKYVYQDGELQSQTRYDTPIYERIITGQSETRITYENGLLIDLNERPKNGTGVRVIRRYNPAMHIRTVLINEFKDGNLIAERDPKGAHWDSRATPEGYLAVVYNDEGEIIFSVKLKK